MERDVIAEYNRRQKEKEERKANGELDGNRNIAQQVAQRMVMNSNYKYMSTGIGYSGLLNPLMLGYTTNDGITYRQKLSFNIDLKRAVRLI